MGTIGFKNGSKWQSDKGESGEIMKDALNPGQRFVVIRDKDIEKNVCDVLFTEEVKQICREQGICFLKSENGEPLPIAIKKREPAPPPYPRQIFEVGLHVRGHHGFVGIVKEAEMGVLSAGNLSLKHFLNLCLDYEDHLLKTPQETTINLVSFVEKRIENEWWEGHGEKRQSDENFKIRYGRERLTTEPETGFRENLFRATENDDGTGVINGYVNTPYGVDKTGKNAHKSLLIFRGNQGDNFFFRLENENSFARSVRASKTVCALCTRDEFIEKLLVAKELSVNNVQDLQKILDNFESVEKFFGQPLKPVFLKEIAKQVVEYNRNNRVGEYRLSKDYVSESFCLVFKNGILPDVRNVVVARTPEEVPSFLGRLVLSGKSVQDFER